MINDSGVFVPHTRSFPGTSNLQPTLRILWQNREIRLWALPVYLWLRV